jgi:uroporphyrinogen III methyltransferase/synthase
MKKGKVYLVGAGPGAEDLITVRGARILQEADVIVYDYLVGKDILKYVNPKAELIEAEKLRNKNGGYSKQLAINKLLIKKAREGKRVVRLKNGDPLIFGRAVEEMESLLKSKLEFAIVPGVTAANAASCLSGIPLTGRECSSSAVFITGQEADGKKRSFISWNNISHSGTIVFYMGIKNISQITKKLLLSGVREDTPAAVISNISRIGQRILTAELKDVAEKVREEGIKPPAIIIIGEIVKKSEKFNWFQKTKKILFTGISPQRYYERGIIFHLPLIEIKPLKSYTKMDSLLKKLNIFDWIVFTSRYGVFYFFDRLFKLKCDSRDLKGIKIAAIGNSTANRLKMYGISVDLVPQKESSQGLLNAFKKYSLENKNILLPRSDISDKGLTEGLSTKGGVVYPCVAYKNIMPSYLPPLNFDFFDEIIFTSPSGVRNFKKRYKRVPKRIRIRWIGDVTKKEVEKQLN